MPRACAPFMTLSAVFSIGLSCQIARAQLPDPSHEWSDLVPGVDAISAALGALATDPSGNIVFLGAQRYVDGQGTYWTTTIGRYGSTGSHHWAKTVTDRLYFDVAADNDGNSFFAGTDREPDGPVIVDKYDANGDVTWTRSTVGGWAMAVRVVGDNIMVAGEFVGTINFGGGPLTGGTDGGFFVVQYDADGLHQWSRASTVMGSHLDWDSQALALDEMGNLVAMGMLGGSVDFGSGALVRTGSGPDLFVVKYGSSGQHVWSRRFGSSDSDGGVDIAFNSVGHVLATGVHDTDIDFGGGVLPGFGTFVVTLDANGNHVWSRSDRVRPSGIACDAGGNVFVTGYFWNTVDFGDGPLVIEGPYDAYMVAFDPIGNLEWSRRFGSDGTDIGHALLADDDGVVLLGSANDSVDLGGGPLDPVHARDWFIARFGLVSVAVAIESFDAAAVHGAARLVASFRSSLDVEAVNVYRSDDDAPMRLIDTRYNVGDNSFEYLDRNVVPGSTYRYQIGVMDGDGEFVSPVAVVTIPRIRTELSQNVPNPFNPTTVIRYVLESRQAATLMVFEANGRLVRTLVDEVRDQGEHTAVWDGRDNHGNLVGSGVYFYRLMSENGAESKKMVLLK